MKKIILIEAADVASEVAALPLKEIDYGRLKFRTERCPDLNWKDFEAADMVIYDPGEGISVKLMKSWDGSEGVVARGDACLKIIRAHLDGRTHGKGGFTRGEF